MKKKVLNFLIIFLFGFLLVSLIKINVTASGLGTIRYSYSRTILKDMTYTYTESNNGKPQRAYVMEYSPKTTGIDCMAVFGEKLFGGDQISHNISLAQSQGYTVIAGVNASPFDTSNGVTVGTTIQNGRILCSQSGPLSSNYDNFAICQDGSAYIGHPNFDFSFSVNGQSSISIKYLNRQKKTDTDDIYLISPEFSDDTKTLANSCEAVLSITSGDLKVGTTISCKVENVYENTTRTKLEKGKLVLVGKSKEALGNLKTNDTVTIKIEDKDSSFDWTKVTQTISGFYQILGVNSYTKQDTKQALYSRSDRNDTHPRTTLGYKQDGTIVVYVADGRQPSVAIGMTDLECSEYMESLGCVAAIRMDGGGSSNLSIRLPGDSKVTTVNNPSDGEERHDADAFLFVLKKDYNKEVNDTLILHAYPNDLKLLQGTKADIVVKATDENYNPKPTPEYEMSVENNIGTITSDKKFQAKQGYGNGKVIIKSGSAKTEVNVNVTNQVDELYASVNNLALSPNDKVKLGVKAYFDSDLLVCSNESFTWTCDSSIGTIDPSGNFTATSDAGKNGYITVSYGKVSAKVVVSIGQLPVEITGFENDSCGTKTNQWRNTQIGGGSGECSINTDLKYVRYGDKSLKIDFNLAKTTGTVGTQIGNGGNVSIAGTPTAIGMWVYATESSKGAWIRLQYSQSGSTGALYADFGHIDWTGWKYLEAELDTTIKYPISVKYLVRIMGVTEEERLNGTIYVDNLRAVYGFTNDDINYPEIKNVSPKENGFTSTTTQSVSFDILDYETGINKDKTKFYLDGKEITNLLIKDIQNGFNVSWTPSALIPLSNGNHNVLVRCEDNTGNFTTKEWSFVVDSTLPKFSATIDKENVNANDTIKYTISTTSKEFNKLTLNINHSGFDVSNIQVISGLTYRIIKDENGIMELELTNDTLQAYVGEVVSINFIAKEVNENIIKVNYKFTNSKYESLVVDGSFEDVIINVNDNACSLLDYIVSRIDEFLK